MISYYILTGKNPAPNQHRFIHFESDLIKDIKNNYRIEWRCLAQFLAETIVKATLQESTKRLSLEAYMANINIALDMVLSNEIVNTHPLLLRELASCIDNDGDLEILEYGRVIIVKTNALGKSVRFELNQRNKVVLVQVEIKKLRKGDENRNNTGKYLENAKNKALSAIKSHLFSNCEGEVGLSEVTVKFESELPNMINHALIIEMAENIKEVRARMELQ